jgi:hypothetical protein
MTLVSTFELLVKPISDPPNQVTRTVVQGYFLTIANTSTLDIALRVLFTATTPEVTAVNSIVVKDVTGANVFTPPINLGGNPNKLYTDVKIPANDTSLVTLLPQFSLKEIEQQIPQKLEIRGYVEIFLLSTESYERFKPVNINLLLTPEHRGTFLPKDINAVDADFDQLAYALPTSNGGSLFTITDTLPALRG